MCPTPASCEAGGGAVPGGRRNRGARHGSRASMILALETSCDDTCAAVADAEGRIHANVISSQEVHGRFGGVVPEIASRQHLEIVNLVVAGALERAGTT